jgi:hypothetical protein
VKCQLFFVLCPKYLQKAQELFWQKFVVYGVAELEQHGADILAGAGIRKFRLWFPALAPGGTKVVPTFYNISS